MRTITKDIQILIDGNPQGFRLTKPDAFSGVEILRLLLRLQDQWDEDERNKGTVFAVPRTWNKRTVPDVPPKPLQQLWTSSRPSPPTSSAPS